MDGTWSLIHSRPLSCTLSPTTKYLMYDSDAEKEWIYSKESHNTQKLLLIPACSSEVLANSSGLKIWVLLVTGSATLKSLTGTGFQIKDPSKKVRTSKAQTLIRCVSFPSPGQSNSLKGINFYISSLFLLDLYRTGYHGSRSIISRRPGNKRKRKN